MITDGQKTLRLVGLLLRSQKNHGFLSDEAALAHPAILHNFRFKNNRRHCDLEPEPCNHSWKLEYFIDGNGDISIINEKSNLDANGTKVPTDLRTDEAKVGSIKMDSNGYFFNFEDRKGENHNQENEIIFNN